MTVSIANDLDFMGIPVGDMLTFHGLLNTFLKQTTILFRMPGWFLPANTNVQRSASPRTHVGFRITFGSIGVNDQRG